MMTSGSSEARADSSTCWAAWGRCNRAKATPRSPISRAGLKKAALGRRELSSSAALAMAVSAASSAIRAARSFRAVGLEGLRFHDLRHTSATLSIAAGASTRELMARMGHSSSAAALRYQHVMAGRDAAIVAALDELIEAASALADSPPSASSGTRVARIGQPGNVKKRRVGERRSCDLRRCAWWS